MKKETTTVTIKSGIETEYRGRLYRSRLEARWAAFFDLMNWSAHYEPFDLNGWIPDFVLQGKKQNTLVEVKPITGMDDPEFHHAVSKAEASGWKGETLIVSYFLPKDIDLCVGWLGEFSGEDQWWWELAPLQETDDKRVIAGFCHQFGSFTDRITGYYPGGSVGSVHHEPEILRRWAEAANLVQWRPQSTMSPRSTFRDPATIPRRKWLFE